MGGLVVLAYALAAPQRVRRLVLVCTGSGGPAFMKAPGALWQRGHPRFRAMAALGVLHLALPNRATERLLNNLIRRESFVDKRLAHTDPIALRDWFRPRTGRADWHRVARKLDYEPRLAEIAVPTLVLGARHDPQFPLASSQQLASRIPGAELVVLEHSGHFPNLEEPTQFWAAVGRFLDGAATSPAHERSPTWKP